jgi:hypothetical protein
MLDERRLHAFEPPCQMLEEAERSGYASNILHEQRLCAYSLNAAHSVPNPGWAVEMLLQRIVVF